MRSIAILLCIAACAAVAVWCARDALPRHGLTPGAVTTDSSGAPSGAQCHGTRQVRPPVGYTNALKLQQMIEYGYKDDDPRDFEEDHLVPLCLGGDPWDRRNLWPQPRGGLWGAERKDQLERAVCRAVCSGRADLEQAQRDVAENWVLAWFKYVWL